MGATAQRTGSRAGLGVICAAHLLIAVDGLAVAIALPALQEDLGIESIDGQWVLSAYALTFGGSLLLGGRLGDLNGRRRTLAGGLGVFAVGALASGLARRSACSSPLAWFRDSARRWACRLRWR